MIRFACAVALASCTVSGAWAPLPQPAGGTATLTFDLGADTGQVRVALFDSRDGYISNQPLRRAAAEASSAPVVVTFRDLPSGEYAVQAYHDVDGDGRMKLNPFGVPLEPYAFSNNAPPDAGPASWETARFTVADDVAQTLRLR